MKRMLFNATHAEELRVAIVDGQKLIDLDLESAIRSEKKGNIYKGVVTKVEPSLEAAFVDYGAEKQGFLPLKEIYRQYFQNYDGKTPINSVKIESVISEGQEMIVQVDKDERGTKGAALTTFISLAGRFLVLMPNNPKGGGISRRISGEDRTELRQIIDSLELKSQHALIARTAGIGRSEDEMQWDLDFLTKLWESVEEAAAEQKAPFLIYQESNLIVRSIRDHLGNDISEIIVDDKEIFDRAERFVQQVMPHNIAKLKLYQDSVPLFSRYQIEHQIDSAFNREVSLPSGGSIVIDHTEALISVDVNSARATKGSDIEDTALQTNLEAVDEVARQLRIRDMGGLIVIDLIDMTISRNQRAVEARLKDALRPDRARVQISKISRFGLLEMSRQRLRSSISDVNYRPCPRCSGVGIIRSVVSSSLYLLRLIEDEAMKENTEAIQVLVPLDMATYLLNEKRFEVNQMEARLASRIIIVPTDELSSPQFHVRRLRGEELEEITGVASFRQKVEHDIELESSTDSLKSPRPEKARVQLDQIAHSAPPAPEATQNGKTESAQRAETADKVGFLARVASIFGSNKSEAEETAETEKSKDSKPRGGNNRRGNQGNRRGGNRSQKGRGNPAKTTKSDGGDGKGNARGNRRGDRQNEQKKGARKSGHGNDGQSAENSKSGQKQTANKSGSRGRNNNRRGAGGNQASGGNKQAQTNNRNRDQKGNPNQQGKPENSRNESKSGSKQSSVEKSVSPDSIPPFNPPVTGKPSRLAPKPAPVQQATSAPAPGASSGGTSIPSSQPRAPMPGAATPAGSATSRPGDSKAAAPAAAKQSHPNRLPSAPKKDVPDDIGNRKDS
ncbi:MAG: Rne/Rng family ribonuclease [Pseudomonadota bacterium]